MKLHGIHMEIGALKMMNAWVEGFDDLHEREREMNDPSEGTSGSWERGQVESIPFNLIVPETRHKLCVRLQLFPGTKLHP